MTTIYSSNFDSASAGQIAPGWGAINGSWQVGTVSPYSGAQSFGDASNTPGAVAVYTGSAAQSDFILSLVQKVADLGISNSYYVGFRGNAAWTQGYLFALENDGTGLRLAFFKRTGSSYAALSTTPASSINFAAGDYVNMEVKGTGSTFEFRVWKAGTTRPSAASFTVTDSSYSSGFPALYRGCDSATPLAVDNVVYTDQAAATAPGAPTIGAATAGNGTASVTFTAPASDGGAAITSYIVTASTGETATGTASPIAISLSNGVARTLHVQAVNSVGTGSASAESNSITPQAAADTTPPTMNGTLAVSSPTADGFTLTWPAASDNLGVAGYEVDDGSGAYSSVGNVLTKTVTGKAPSTTYNPKVRAFDAAGNRATAPLTTSATTAAGPVTIPVTNANVYFSPFNWYSDGSGAMQGNNVRASSTLAWANMRGSYLKFRATVGASGSITLNISTATLGAIAAAGCPQIAWSIGSGAIQSRTLAAGDSSLSLATGLAAGTYDVFVWYRGVYILQDGGQAQNYTTPNNRFQVTGVVLSAGGTLSAPAVRGKTMIAYGDSITEGDLSNGGPRSATSQDASLTYGWLLAEALDAEVGIVGFYGMNWAWFDSTWSNYAQGMSRLISGRLTPAPDYVTINYGENDGNPGPAASTVTATLAAISAAAPAAKIINLIPFSGRARANLSAATLPANGYRIDLAPPEMVNGALVWSYDGQHPNQRGHANLASLLANRVNALSAPPPSTTARTFSVTLGNADGAAASRTGLHVNLYDTPNAGTSNTTDANGTLSATAQSTLASGQTGYASVLDPGTGEHWTGPVQVA